MKKFVIYTARFGEPGRFNFPRLTNGDIGGICYTDLDIKEGCNQKIPVLKGRFKQNDFYQMKRMRLKHLMPIRRQRFVKICIPDEIFNNYEYSLYVDCKRPVLVDFNYLLSCLGPESDYALRKHKRRDCAYEEAEWLIKKDKHDTAMIQRQVEFYRRENFPSHYGLYWSVMLFRRHTKSVKEFSRLWWQQVEKYSFRDQVSFPYVVWKHDMKISLFTRFK